MPLFNALVKWTKRKKKKYLVIAKNPGDAAQIAADKYKLEIPATPSSIEIFSDSGILVQIFAPF